MNINFYPESNLADYSQAISEYTSIWQQDGQKIVAAIEKFSGLTFKETMINAIVCMQRGGHSNPLRLYAQLPLAGKRRLISHELTHRVCAGNSIVPKAELPGGQLMLNHQQIYLILYDIWVYLYGTDFAHKAIQQEKKHSKLEYRQAWEWALSFSPDERIVQFKHMISGCNAPL